MKIDDYLGDFETRYFGMGHKKTKYYFENNKEENNEYRFSMKQNSLWSEKNGVEQTAHLSTIDGLVLANMAAEIFLRTKLMIDIDKIYLFKFEIRAGNAPIENLNDISVSYTKSKISRERIELHYSISGMRIILGYKSIDDEIIMQVSDTNSYMFDGQVIYLTNHLSFLMHDISTIDRFGNKGIICDVKRTGDLPIGLKGVNSSLQKIPSLIEWLVIFSQMAQVVAYNFDCIKRRDSNTLWMKHVQAEVKQLSFYTEEQSTVWGEVTEAKIIKMKNQTWRTFAMVGEASDHHVDFAGKIVHQLPQK